MGGKSASNTAKAKEAPEQNFGGNLDDELSCVAQSPESKEMPKQSANTTSSLNLFYNNPDDKKQIQFEVDNTEELKDNGYRKADRPSRPSKKPEPLPMARAKGNGSGGLLALPG